MIRYKLMLKHFKIMIALALPLLILYFLNEAFHAKNETESKWNKVALHHIKDIYGEQSGFKESNVSISKWIKMENQLSQDVIKSELAKKEEASKKITDETLQLVSLRDEFKKLSLEVRDVTAKMNAAGLSEEAKNLILEKYNKKLSELSSKMESVSASILSMSDTAANPLEPYYPDKVVYANATIHFGGKILGMKEKTFPIIIDTAKKEVISPENGAAQFTAVSQIVQQNDTTTHLKSVKMALLLLFAFFSVFALHILKQPKDEPAYTELDQNSYNM